MKLLVPFAFIAGLTVAAPAPAKLIGRNTNSTGGCTTCNKSREPCAIISEEVKAFYSVPSNKLCPLDPEIANACLLSSTIDSELAFSYVTELKKYVEFQSTLAYLKDPPKDYPYAPVDILGGLDRIVYDIATGSTGSQYILDQSIQDLFNAAHEGHLSGAFCTSNTGIGFRRPINLVSASFDGIAVPNVLIYEDVESGTRAISNVVKINGQNPTDFLEQEALVGGGAGFDPDASYNFLMHSKARVPNAGSPFGTFRAPLSYPGPWTNITFANGTTNHYRTEAYVIPDAWSTTITDGISLTDFYCIIPAKTSALGPANATAPLVPTSSPSPAPTKFPSTFPYNPIILDYNNQVAGYYLNGTAYADTAVLWVGTFEQGNNLFGNPDTLSESFQKTVKDWFAELRSSGKKKIIVDMSGNPGGNAMMPDDLFRHFFPSVEPTLTARARVGAAADIWGQTIAAIPDEIILPTAAERAAGPGSLPFYKTELDTCPYNWRSALTKTFKPFTGWYSSFFPPNLNHGDSFTADFRLPLRDGFFTELYDGIDIYGYEKNPALYLRPFQPEDIIIVTDGYCSSACSHFVELMTRQGGVRTIALGGRPQREPMQAIGGTKGFLMQTFLNIAVTSNILSQNFGSYIPPRLLSLAGSTFPGLVNPALGDPLSLKDFRLNMEDTIPLVPDAGKEGVPLQFVFEQADCRFFYTPEMILEPKKTWEVVWDLTWGTNRECSWATKDWRL